MKQKAPKSMGDPLVLWASLLIKVGGVGDLFHVSPLPLGSQVSGSRS